MNGLVFQIRIGLLAGLIPLGCAGALAGAGPRPQAQAAEPDDGVEQGRAASALAYEHYLKARLLFERRQLREAVSEMRQALVYDHGSPHLHVFLGRLYRLQGLWRMAGKEANLALEIQPDHMDALMLKAPGLIHAKKLDDAIEVYKRVITLDRKRIGAYTGLAMIYVTRKGKENEDAKAKVLEILKEMTEANPDSAEGFRKLGEFYFEQGDEKKAEKHFRRVLQLETSDRDTIKALTGLLEQQGRYKEAIQVFVEALESSPENPQYMAVMARLYLKDDDHESARAYIEQMRDSNPANASLIAQAYVDINRHAEAIAELEKVVADHPHQHFERYMVAVLYEGLKKWEKALEHLRKIPTGSRLFVRAQTSIGYTLHHMGRLDEAARVLLATLKLTDDAYEVGQLHRYLAAVHAKQKRFDQGLRFLDAAIGKQPDLSDLHDAKANLLFEAGRGAEGVAALRRELDRHPSDVSLLYALGALYERMGKIPESLEVMRKVLALEPNNYSALNFIGYTMADQGIDLDEAELMIRRALLLNPGNGAITDSLGWVLYKKGDFEQALEYLQRADRTSPGESVIIMHVGDAFLKLGKREQAIEHYRSALAADPEPRDRAEILKRFKDLGVEP